MHEKGFFSLLISPVNLYKHLAGRQKWVVLESSFTSSAGGGKWNASC